MIHKLSRHAKVPSNYYLDYNTVHPIIIDIIIRKRIITIKEVILLIKKLDDSERAINMMRLEENFYLFIYF